jgi:hypothetical protein
LRFEPNQCEIHFTLFRDANLPSRGMNIFEVVLQRQKP